MQFNKFDLILQLEGLFYLVFPQNSALHKKMNRKTLTIIIALIPTKPNKKCGK